MFGRKQTYKLIENIDRYFDLMDQSVLVFKDGVRNYLYSNKPDFNENLKKMSSLEGETEVLRREIENALSSEAKQIEKRIPQNAYKIALCVEGKALSSEALAELEYKNEASGKPMCFIIGSSYGLSQSIKDVCDMRLSLSAMTFPHQLFRVMLLEQIYRAFKINEGSTYHK